VVLLCWVFAGLALALAPHGKSAANPDRGSSRNARV
jgi:hypothetical protein